MKTLVLLVLISIASITTATAQTEFKLEPSQSMLMTGKGPGQDATINPFYGHDCFAVIENLGDQPFSVRVQDKGKIVKTVSIKKGETKDIKLSRYQELYLDTEEVTKAKVDYKAIEKK